MRRFEIQGNDRELFRAAYQLPSLHFVGSPVVIYSMLLPKMETVGYIGYAYINSDADDITLAELVLKFGINIETCYDDKI